MKAIKIFLFILFPLMLSAQAQPKTKFSSQRGLVKFCLGSELNRPQKYCWQNREGKVIYNPVNGSFSISVPSEAFKLDTAVFDSLPLAATTALRQAPDFIFSGEIVPLNPINFDSYGEYTLRLNGTISHADSTFRAAANATLVVNANGKRLSADLSLAAQEYKLRFFEQFGIPEDRIWLMLDFELLAN